MSVVYECQNCKKRFYFYGEFGRMLIAYRDLGYNIVKGFNKIRYGTIFPQCLGRRPQIKPKQPTYLLNEVVRCCDQPHLSLIRSDIK